MKKHLAMLKTLMIVLALAFTTQGYAQQLRISGKVSSTTDGQSIPGVNIVVKNTTSGTTTDINGNYSISVDRGVTMVFSFIGYDTYEVLVGSQTTINVALQPSVTTLEEVVVIGYGTVKKSDATGSISTVSSKDFNRGAITSAQDLLVGKSAGVVITTSGGAPGSGSTIRIRGGSSLNASNDPLIIIDGVPIDNINVSGSSNFLSFINPNDIESFTVLKDASATAIYGSRASNGVIIITTKRGVAGSPMQLTYNASTSISAATRFLDVYSGDQVRQIAFEYKDLFGADSYHKLGTENTNWQKEIYRSAVSQDHNLGLTGAFKTVPYMVSLGYTNQDGILKNTDMQRFTGAFSLNPTFFDNGLKVNINAKGMSTKHNFGSSGAVGDAIRMSPTRPIMDDNSASAGYFQWQNYGANLGTANPVERALEADNRSDVNRFLGNVQFDYQLPFLTDLRAILNLATDYAESEGHNNRPTTSPSVITAPLWGRLTDYSAKNLNNLLDFYLNYTKDLSQINSRIDATAGYSWQYLKNEGDNYTRGIVDALHPYQRTDSSTFINEVVLVSFFGRLNYSLMNKYLLTFTLRNDGSSRFSKENRWGLFPSAAFAWKIKEEAFIKNVDFISDLKLRLGWGITGQQDIGSYYPYMATYISSSMGNFYMIDGTYIPTLRPSPYDPDIKWEETSTQNIGIDFGFLKDRITGSFDLYKRVTEDLLNEVTVPTGSNFSNRLMTNVGSLENKGAELALNLIPISQKDMSLNIGFNLTYNKNKITKLLISDEPNFIGVLYGDAFTGQNQVTRVGHPAYSFFVNKQVYDADGKPIEGLYVDLSGIGGVVGGDNADKYIYKNPTPDYLFGFSFRFNYKNFDVMASSRASIGNYVYNAIAAGSSLDQMYQIGYWRNMPTMLDDTKFVKRQFTSDYFVENASFLKLDNFSMGYNFDNIYRKLNARVSFTVQNVFTITNYSGLDPEVSDGIDRSFYPRPRTFLLGISLGY
ncbi:MAG: TonB-dependent receptor [Bacteroidales bacterium]|nr:TonB-dependent receptor [Bacteroidales bacterium]MDZ4204315.1 TonB-dependent receptor [Bacteroidales bacterium]